MKNLNIYKSAIALATVCIAMMSCEDKLNELPPNTLIAENAISSEATAETAINGIYSYFGNYGELVAFSITNQAIRSNLVEASTQRSSYELELSALEVQEDWVYIKNLWVDIFKVINASNNVIQQLGKFENSEFSPNRREEMLAEARFMRGYAHLYQMKMFAHFWDVDSEHGPLIRLEPSGLNNNFKARSSVSEGYEAILADLRYAAEFGPEFTSIYRSSSSLAKAYLVETLLMRGNPGDNAEAAEIAEDVITNSEFTLATTFPLVYSAGYNSTELMFSRDIRPENENVTDLVNSVASVYSLLGRRRNPPTDNYFTYVTPDDTRYASIIGNVVASNGVAINNTFIKHFELSGDVPMRFMRLTQMYLYQAEALAKSGASVAEVLAPLNVLRLRAGMPEFDANEINDDDLMQVIFNELVIEVGVENGSEYFAAVRMNDSSGERIIFTLNEAVQSENQLALPIPFDELLFNPEMTPNPL